MTPAYPPTDALRRPASGHSACILNPAADPTATLPPGPEGSP